ncbi:MAG: hypothetical protein LAO22_21670 [Acidobacteriia bacterium]|nr:hypothetical protein [Terriglobia bacterium]
MQTDFEILAHVGNYLMATSWIVLILDLSAMAIYTIRSGSRDSEKQDSGSTAKAILASSAGTSTTSRPIVAGTYRSRKKILVQASGFVTDDALVDGTATLGQRMMVRGIKLWFACMWLIMVSGGLWMLPNNILGVILIVGPSIWFSMVVRVWHRDYRAAQRRVEQRKATTQTS